MPDYTPMFMHVLIGRTDQARVASDSADQLAAVESVLEASLTARFDAIGFTSRSIDSPERFTGGPGTFLTSVRSVQHEPGSPRGRSANSNPAWIRVSFTVTEGSGQVVLSDVTEQGSLESLRIAINRTSLCMVWQVTEADWQHLVY